jgi:flagellar motility protein MotE (MotC chaperone)
MLRIPTPRLLPLAILALGGALAQRLILLGWSLAAPQMPAPLLLAAAAAETARPSTAAATTTPPTAAPAPPPSEDPAGLLVDLRARRTQLATREQALAAREALLHATEARIDERMSQMAALQARLEQQDAERRAHEAANWAGLVKLYESMKPREAATIFNDLDQQVLLGLLDRMKEAKAALVLGAMLPDRARDATAALAKARARREAAPGEADAGGAARKGQ